MPNYEEIDFCSHCKDRQKQRDITHQQKIGTVKNPDGELPAVGSKRRKFWKRIRRYKADCNC
jgi:hypothetical protein